jgi:hypothetical protein
VYKVAVGFEADAQELANRRFIFEDKNLAVWVIHVQFTSLGRVTGNVIRMQVPRPFQPVHRKSQTNAGQNDTDSVGQRLKSR